MTRLCERPGCSAPASVAYGFEASERIVVLDRLADHAARAAQGALCLEHADRMRPPLGWLLMDRRVDSPRLFLMGDESEPPDPPSRSDDTRDPTGPTNRPPRRRPLVVGEELPLFDHSELGGTSSSASDDSSDDARSAGDDPGVDGAAREDGGSDVERPARGDTGPSDAAGAQPEPEPRAARSAADDTAGLWTPVFDRSDDLDGQLRADSRLLSRAFGVVPTSGGQSRAHPTRGRRDSIS